MSMIKTILAKIFGNTYVKTPLLGILASIIIILGVALYLRIRTQHGQSFPVPDMRGLTIDEAIAMARKNQLRAEITDSTYIMNRTPGSIIEQIPEPGTHVKTNRRIFMIVNAKSPMKVRMPNVVGYTLRQAKAILELEGLSVGVLRFRADLGTHNVLAQTLNGDTISAGTLIPKGTKVELVLGRGMYGEQTNLPQLVGLKLNDAQNLIIEAALNIGKIQFDETIKDYKDSLEARVYNQYPAYSSINNIAFGTKVNIWLTLNQSRIPQRDTTNTPIFKGGNIRTNEDEEILE